MSSQISLNFNNFLSLCKNTKRSEELDDEHASSVNKDRDTHRDREEEGKWGPNPPKKNSNCGIGTKQ